MERILIIDPSNNFISAIASFIVKEIKNPTNTIVIFPNIRPSYYLKKEIAKFNPGGSVFPEIYSCDEFITKITLKHRLFKPANFYDAFMLFSKYFRKDVECLYSREITNDDILTVSQILWSEFEELMINKINPQKIRDYDFILSEAKLSVSNQYKDITSKKLFRYSELYFNFYKKLHDNSKFTRAMMYYDTSENLKKSDLPYIDTIIVAGFFIMTKSEKDIFMKIYKEFNSYFFFQDHELLSDKISFLTKSKRNTEKRVYEFELKASPSRHAEIFVLKEDLYSISERDAENKIVTPPSTSVILPDPQTIWPLIEYILGDVKEFNITAQCSLDHTPWMSLFEIIKKIISEGVKFDKEIRYPIKRLLSLFSHPYVKKAIKINEELEFRFEIFITLDEIREKFFKNKDDGSEFISVFIEAFEKVKDIGDFLESIERITNFILDRAGGSDFVDIGRFINQEILKIKINEISRLKFEKIDSYFDLLRKILINITFPFKGEPIKGLQCMGILESRLLSFENVFVMDVNSDIIPYEKKDICILSDIVRKKLGLPLYNDNFELYYYYLSNIISSSKRTILYFVENKKMMKSPIIEKMIWEKEKLLKRLTPTQVTTYPKLEFYVTTRREIKKTPQIKKILNEFIFSPSALDLYIKCPIMFYYSYILGIKEDTKGEDINKNEIGDFFHTILEKTFRGFRDERFSDIDEKKFIERFRENLETEICKRKFDQLSPQTYFIKSQINSKAKSIIEKMKAVFKNYTIKEIEFLCCKKINFNKRVISIKGRADLIIESENDMLIIDFKTSSNPKNHLPKFSYFEGSTRTLSPGSIQMPFYILVFEKIKRSNSCIVSLGSKNCEYKTLYSNLDERQRYHPLIEKFILSKITEIIEDDYFKPTEDSPCDECPYNQICSIL